MNERPVGNAPEEPMTADTDSIKINKVVQKLNRIFNENWQLNNLEGALNGVELIVDQMAQELEDVTVKDKKQHRLIALDVATRTQNPATTVSSLVNNASVIEKYLNGDPLPPASL